ncbi:DUF58 domain-containing protein [Tenuifilum thalassicum]|uniref:DUF58 domain-containing protein n=1 Tax=Tenuifilum thalassicum TaxID=2590900 RepID=A0A7D4AX86_9BACT|nr:DUF58 domain-containing protein [Tenuifilum thalassicum]QKG80014.1 DUF58 domain-containing protein [Tenuifilum thalassicum]
METSELLKRVRRIEIKTRGLTRQIFAGQYHSAFKGRGMAFSEVREYRYGDDIRNIDWNVTARYNQPYVKVFEEERELTVMLLIDVSGSQNFGSAHNFKRHVIAEVAAVLAFSAIQNNDKIGVILFSDRVEKFIPPQKGRKHTLRIISEVLNFQPQGRETNLAEALRFLTNAIKKRSTAFVLSDFIDFDSETEQPRFSEAITIANNKHDVVGIRVYDFRETQFPQVGLLRVKDAETGKDIWVDSNSYEVQETYKKWWNTTSESLRQTFNKAKVDWVSIRTDVDYVKPLILLFKRRAK